MPIYKTNRRKDGKQQYRVKVNYTDREGKHRQVERTTYGYDVARDLEHQLKIQYRKNMDELGQLTFVEFFSEYINYKKHDIRETTIEKKKEIVQNHIIPYFGDVIMTEISATMVIDWKNQINDTNLGIVMKRHCYKQLRAVLNFALDIGAIHENPTNKVGNFKDAYLEIDVPEEKLQYYTAEEFTLFITTARNSIDNFLQWGVWVFFCLAYYTGMRKGEIHALKWSDIDQRGIHVRRSISQKVKGKKYVEAPPKNKSSLRTLQIPEPLRIVLQQHRERQQEEFPVWTEDYRVCGGDRCISDTSIANYNRRWAESSGLHVIRIHDYRHSHATLLVNEGINIQEIARRLGHSNVQITWNRYAHLYPREEVRALSILNKITF